MGASVVLLLDCVHHLAAGYFLVPQQQTACLQLDFASTRLRRYRYVFANLEEPGILKHS